MGSHALPRSRILVVDDEPAMLRAVERILVRQHRVFCHSSPQEALSQAPRQRPHVAIVDVQMSGMDGFDLTRALKQLDPQLRVILMTGSAYGTDEKLIRAIEEQVFYFIHKPFDRTVLRTLVARCLELRRLEDENHRYLEHLESQLAEARAFQRTMLPAPRAELEGLRIHTAYHPSTELAGDLCDYAVAAPAQVAVLVADVVGHGASAAMLTALVKSSFNAVQSEGYDPEAVVRRVSEGIAAFDPGRFVTLLAARIDRAAGRLDYVNAGHEGGLIARPGEAARLLESTGPIISPALINLGLGWSRASVPFPARSRLLLYTDGISEAALGAEEFGRQPLIDRLGEGLADAELLDTLLADVERFSPEPAADDRTLLTVTSL
ncbi:MAG: fused response regulator/phosphatase [Acidobacteriota bacterium]